MYKFLGLTALLIGFSGTVFAEQKSVDSDLSISNVWARATTKSQKTSAAYFYLKNASNVERVLISASSPVAEIVQLHTHITQPSGIMTMEEVLNVLVPAKGVVEFKPGSFHVMIIGLHEQLVLGREIPITLNFKNGYSRTVRAKIKPMNMKKMKGMKHHKHMKMDM